MAKNECVSLDGNIQELYGNEPTGAVTSVFMHAQKFSSPILEDSTDTVELGAAIEMSNRGFNYPGFT